MTREERNAIRERINVQVVYEREDAYDLGCGPYGYEKVGIRINDRVIWLSTFGSHGGVGVADHERWQRIAHHIVSAVDHFQRNCKIEKEADAK